MKTFRQFREMKQLDLGLSKLPTGKGSFEKIVSGKIKFKGFSGKFAPEGTKGIEDYYIAVSGHPKFGFAGFCQIFKVTNKKTQLHIETREHFGKYWVENEYLIHPLYRER